MTSHKVDKNKHIMKSLKQHTWEDENEIKNILKFQTEKVCESFLHYYKNNPENGEKLIKLLVELMIRYLNIIEKIEFYKVWCDKVEELLPTIDMTAYIKRRRGRDLCWYAQIQNAMSFHIGDHEMFERPEKEDVEITFERLFVSDITRYKVTTAIKKACKDGRFNGFDNLKQSAKQQLRIIFELLKNDGHINKHYLVHGSRIECAKAFYRSFGYRADHGIKEGKYTIDLKRPLKESGPNREAENDIRLLLFNS